MEKFSDQVFDNMLSIREDIEEIFQNLIDVGFDLDMNTYYTDLNFNLLSNKNLETVKGYYYGFEISLRRKIEPSGHNTDGSFVYDDNISTLGDIYESIGRLKSTYSKYKIYYHIMSAEKINVRVIIGKKENKNSIDYEKIRDILYTRVSSNYVEHSVFKKSIFPTMNMYTIRMDEYYAPDLSYWKSPIMNMEFSIFLTEEGHEEIINQHKSKKQSESYNRDDYIRLVKKLLDLSNREFGGVIKWKDKIDYSKYGVEGSISKNGRNILTITVKPDDLSVISGGFFDEFRKRLLIDSKPNPIKAFLTGKVKITLT